jgi:hypothetical protein
MGTVNSTAMIESPPMELTKHCVPAIINQQAADSAMEII